MKERALRYAKAAWVKYNSLLKLRELAIDALAKAYTAGYRAGQRTQSQTEGNP